MKFKIIKQLSCVVALSVILSACNKTPSIEPKNTSTAQPTTGNTQDKFKVGLIMVGPKNDAGWSQAHYEGIEYVKQKLSDVELDYVDKVNPGDRPNIKGSQVADDLIAKGAKVIIFNSDDFKDDALTTAKKYPNIPIIHATGDYAWKEGKNYKNLPNLSNIMPEIEYGKMIAGCAAALNTQTGKIGYIGPLINDETRRIAVATYLGSKYCWEKYRKKDAKELNFKLTWIGFWFNIPGQTLDPTKVADDFYNTGYDVVMTGIDTPEAAIQGKKAAEAGKKVKFVHYDLKTGCDLAPDICIAVPYYNWGPSYLDSIKQARSGQFKGDFLWVKPDWKDLNNPDTSAVGFVIGKAMDPENKKFLDEFIKGLGDGSINLFKGPIKFQDGTDFLKPGETATPQQIWYMSQLFQGMEGPSK